MTTTQTGLEISDLTVHYEGAVAVDHVSLAAPLGRLTGLIGPNGAGKTSIFNACSGLLRPTTGHVRLFGRDVTRLGPAGRARLGMGRTFQRMELFSSLTVAENVALGREAGVAGSSPLRQFVGTRREQAAVHKAMADALHVCGISQLADVTVAKLSTGQRRFVELARVHAGGFRLLLLDEPSSGLDHSESQRFGEILRTIIDEREVGILLVEHDMTLVMGVCDYLYVLDFGRLIFQGTTTEAQCSPVVQAAYLGTAEVLATAGFSGAEGS